MAGESSRRAMESPLAVEEALDSEEAMESPLTVEDALDSDEVHQALKARLAPDEVLDSEEEPLRPPPSSWGLRTRAPLVCLVGAVIVILFCHGGFTRGPDVARAVQVQHWDGKDVQMLNIMNCMPGLLPRFWTAEPTGAPTEIRVLTYNLFWWNLFLQRGGNGGSASRLIAQSGPFDIMGFQECEDVARVIREAGLTGQYGVFEGDGSKTCAICMAYKLASWRLLAHGFHYVAKDNLGKRAAQWMRLQHLQTGRKVYFLNHHGPLPLNSGGRCGGAATAYNLLQMVGRYAMPGDVIILVGDFNANGASKTIQHLEWRLRKVFAGLMCGGIDNVFSNLGPEHVIDTRNLGNGGSDHDALSVDFRIGVLPRTKRPWWWPPRLFRLIWRPWR